MSIGNSGRRALLALTLIASLYPLAHSVSACAGEPASDPNWTLEQLMRNLSQVKNLKGKFVEVKHLRIMNAPLEFSGTLLYTAPWHLEKHTLLPKPQSLTLEQDRLTVEDKTKKQRRTLLLQDHPVMWAFVESIRSTLAGDVQALNRFYRVELTGREDQWRLLLRPHDPKLQSVLRVIRISGSRHSVRTIEIEEGEGDRSVMTITEDPQ